MFFFLLFYSGGFTYTLHTNVVLKLIPLHARYPVRFPPRSLSILYIRMGTKNPTLCRNVIHFQACYFLSVEMLTDCLVTVAPLHGLGFVGSTRAEGVSHCIGIPPSSNHIFANLINTLTYKYFELRLLSLYYIENCAHVRAKP